MWEKKTKNSFFTHSEMDHWSREDSVDTIVILSGSETVPKQLL